MNKDQVTKVEEHLLNLLANPKKIASNIQKRNGRYKDVTLYIYRTNTMIY